MSINEALMGLQRDLARPKLGGFEVIYSNSPAFLAPNKQIKLTWKERLFSWPWRPRVRFRYEEGEPFIMQMGSKIIIHHKYAHLLKKGIDGWPGE